MHAAPSVRRGVSSEKLNKRPPCQSLASHSPRPDARVFSESDPEGLADIAPCWASRSFPASLSHAIRPRLTRPGDEAMIQHSSMLSTWMYCGESLMARCQSDSQATTSCRVLGGLTDRTRRCGPASRLTKLQGEADVLRLVVVCQDTGKVMPRLRAQIGEVDVDELWRDVVRHGVLNV
jgi:hypothetical protein